MTAKSALRKSAGVVSVIAVVNAVVVGSVASGAPSTTLHLPKPLHVISRNVSTVNLRGGHTIDSSALTKPSTGNMIGSGAWTCVNTSDAAILKCKSAFALSNGIVVTQETINVRTGTLSGKVMSGAGEYEGVNGTVRGHAHPAGGVVLTISYSVD